MAIFLGKSLTLTKKSKNVFDTGVNEIFWYRQTHIYTYKTSLVSSFIDFLKYIFVFDF